MTQFPLQVLFVGHEASRTGAPVGFLSLMQWFKDQGIAEPLIWLRHGGPLTEAHAALGPLATGTAGQWPPEQDRPVHLAYLNTATLGGFAEQLAGKGIPVICHVHEMEYGLRVTGARNLRQLRQHVARFIACSQAVKAALIRVLEVEESKIDVIPECVDVERALRMSQTPIPDFPATAGRRIVGMGTVNWRKGVDLFLRVLAHLNNQGQVWQGVWIGDLESSPDRDELVHDIRVLGLAERIHFTGSLANPFPHLAQADVYCLTSREDPYPLAMVEAAALGKPIVGFRGSGGVEEFAAAAVGRIVDSADAAALAEAVRDCLTSKPQRGREAAERLCLPGVVGKAIARLMAETALPQPLFVDTATVSRLQRASQPSPQVKVRLLPAEGANHAVKTCEQDVTSEGRVVVTEPWPGLPPAFAPECQLTIEPQGRSVIVRQLEVQVQSTASPFCEPLRVKVSTGGRALLCSGDAAPKAWLCLDGKGRVIVELRLPEALKAARDVTFTVSWEQSLEVKEGLSSLAPRKPAESSIQAGFWSRWRRWLKRGKK